MMRGREWQNRMVRLTIPFSEPGLSTTMLLEVVGERGRHILIECGDGTSNFLFSVYGRDTTRYGLLSDVMITHEHMDHAGGIPSLLLLLEVAGRTEELNIFTPCGEKGFVGNTVGQLRPKLHYMVNVADSHDKLNQSDKPGIEFRSFRTRHRDSFPSNRCGEIVPSNGYCIKVNGGKLVFSGDTGPCSELEEECREAELAVIESTWEKPVDCDSLHLTVAQAKRYGSLAKDHILIHPLREG
jgi:ribonuclease BN (tRNA processing enzyme)